MRFSKLLLTIAAAGAAVAVAAQESEPVGLEAVQGSVDELKDETAPPEPAPAEPAPAEPAPAESEPAEPTPAPPAPAPAPAESEQPAPEAPAPAEPAAPQAEPAPQPPTAPAPTAPAPETPSQPAPPLTRAELTQVQRLAERGRLLGTIARAGMVATQDMLSRVADPEAAGISGWLAQAEGNGMAVTFYADSEAGPRAVYRANVLGGRVVSREVHIGDDRPPLTAIQARMAAARAAAAGQQHRPCAGDQFNYLVVPPGGPDAPIDVYQVTPPTQRNRFPIGGHFRTTVGADGSIADTRGFTNACLDLEAPAAAGRQPRPIGVVHLLDPMPTEIHVLAAQLFGRPLLVATGEPQRVWLVTGERIAEVRP